MATVAQVAKAALQRILVQASESDLEPSEYQDLIFAMNNLMADLAADGVNLGYTQVTDLGDQVTVPVGALRGLIANVAVECAADYGGIVSESLALAAREGLKVMRKLGQSMGPSRYPSTLPTGSGNYDWDAQPFYPESEAAILAEANGTIGLESNTP
jgi:hypothetical protein